MATIPTNPSQQTSATNASTMQGQCVYMMPVPQQGSRPRIIRPVPGVKCLSIAIIVLASVLPVVGIVAAVIMARYSYLGNPIWTGLCFLLSTGILGVLVHKKPGSFGMKISFLVMTIVASVAAFQLFVYSIAAATNEFYYCNPSPSGWDYVDSYYYLCTPQWSRVVVDVIIILCTLAALVLCVVSFSLTLYGTFSCCYNCCNTNQSPAVHYAPNTGTWIPMSNQSMPAMIPVPTHQGQGWGNVNQPSSQPFLVASSPQFTQNAPPAYMPITNIGSTQPPTVPANHQVAPGPPSAPPGIPYAPLVTGGNIQVPENNPQAAVVKPEGGTQTNTSCQSTENPQNWEKF